MYNDKLTMRQVKAAGIPIIRVGYCELQNVLNHFHRIGYCAGKYGWNCDVYRSSQYIITTGYRSFGDIKAPYDTCVKWERKAMEAMQTINPSEREATAWKLLDGFCDDVVKGGGKMTKREYCLNHPAAAVYPISLCFCWELHGIEYGIDDAAYLPLRSDTGLVSYHRRRIYTTNGDNARDYVKVGNSRLYLDDFLRV